MRELQFRVKSYSCAHRRLYNIFYTTGTIFYFQ